MSAIQIKDVPEDLHSELRRRAEEAGLTLSDYLLEALRRDLRRQRTALWFDALRADPAAATPTGFDSAGAIRDAREERDSGSRLVSTTSQPKKRPKRKLTRG